MLEKLKIYFYKYSLGINYINNRYYFNKIFNNKIIIKYCNEYYYSNTTLNIYYPDDF